MYKWFLAFRYLHTKIIAYFGVAAVMLCVAMVLVVLSVMGGFLDTVRARSRGLLSEIVVECGTAQGFPFYEEFGTYLDQHLSDVVRKHTPVIYTYGAFRVPAISYTKLARVMGIRVDEFVQLNDFGKGLNYEKWYPGTTTLGLQRMPIAGVNPLNGNMSLPVAHAAALSKWRESTKDSNELEEYDRQPFMEAPDPYVTSSKPGARVFATVLGEPGEVGPEEFGAIVGSDMLHTRRADGGFDRQLARGADVAITVWPLSPIGNPLGEQPVKVPLRYADDVRTGIYEIDSMSVYVDFGMLQHKLAMDPQQLEEGGMTKPRASQLLIGLKPGVDINEAKIKIKAAWNSFYAGLPIDITDADSRALSFVEVYTWEDLQRQFIAAVEKEKVLVTILFGLISMVAIVLVGCIFYMIVEKKTKDIGILKSLGASSRGVAVMFIFYAGVVGIVGSALGLLVGSIFVWNINAVQDGLAKIHPSLRVWSAEVYSFDIIPNVVKPGDAFWIAIIAILASMVGSLIPAWIAARVWPVRALRYE